MNFIYTNSALSLPDPRRLSAGFVVKEQQSFHTRLTQLLGIEHPVLQGGMRWAARAQLVAAVSNAGGFGFLSAHTQPDGHALALEIQRARTLTSKPFGVNLTLLAANSGLDYEGYVETIIGEGVPAVETAGSNPSRYIERFKKAGVKVIHKCTTLRHAVKAEQLGVDAVTIDGFECAGHPGNDDVPGLILIPAAADQLKIPVVACGGFADGRGLIAALALGAEGINMGTRFLLTQESPVHPRVKARLLEATELDTLLVGRSLGDPVRVLKNSCAEQASSLDRLGTKPPELADLISSKRWMQAMQTGRHEEAAIPIGLSVALIDDLPSCAELIGKLIADARRLVASRLN
jgi:nitronate monooxygenase